LTAHTDTDIHTLTYTHSQRQNLNSAMRFVICQLAGFESRLFLFQGISTVQTELYSKGKSVEGGGRRGDPLVLICLVASTSLHLPQLAAVCHCKFMYALEKNLLIYIQVQTVKSC